MVKRGETRRKRAVHTLVDLEHRTIRYPRCADDQPARGYAVLGVSLFYVDQLTPIYRCKPRGQHVAPRP